MDNISLVKSIDPVQALSYGAIGVGLVLGMLAFLLLLRKNQAARPVYVFMAFALALVIIGSVNEYARLVVHGSVEAALRAANDKQVEALRASIDAARKQTLAITLAKIEEARRMAQGASTNTSDANGATRAAYAASLLSQDALNMAHQLDSKLAEVAAKGS